MKKTKYSYATSMSINDWHDFENDEDIHFAIAKLDFLTTSTPERHNTHKHLISKEVLEEYAPSFLGKFLVAEFDGYEYKGHTEKQNMIGYIYPKEMQDVEYYEDKYGITHAVVTGVISKIYATDVYSQFVKDGNRCSVSVEMLSAFTEETEDIIDGYDFKECIAFDGCGVTLLGTKLRPSVQGANIIITRFSEDETKLALDKYNEITKTPDLGEQILSKLDDINKKLDGKETEMAKVTKADAIQESTEETLNTAETVAMETVEEEKEVEMAEETVVEEETPEETEMKEETKCAECTAFEEKIALQEAELAELRKFKEDVQASQKMAVVESTMSKIKDMAKDTGFDEVKLSEFEQEGKECSLSAIDAWRNKVVANVATFALENKKTTDVKKTEVEFDMGVVREAHKPKTIYD